MQTALRSSATRSPLQTQRVARTHSTRIMASYHDQKANSLDGKAFDFGGLKGKVTLVTNVACQCGLTSSNYKEMVELQNKYGDKGLVIQCWPCNQFGRQEPGGPDEIAAFVKGKGGDGLAMMEKIEVNGPGTHPAWSFLLEQSGDKSETGWNFGTKFIVDKEGKVVERNGDNPMKSEAKIKALLGL